MKPLVTRDVSGHGIHLKNQTEGISKLSTTKTLVFLHFQQEKQSNVCLR